MWVTHMNNIDKEVYFFHYCPTCKHKDLAHTEEPCNECLHEPTAPYSHKPVKYEEKENKKK